MTLKSNKNENLEDLLIERRKIIDRDSAQVHQNHMKEAGDQFRETILREQDQRRSIGSDQAIERWIDDHGLGQEIIHDIETDPRTDQKMTTNAGKTNIDKNDFFIFQLHPTIPP